MLHDLVQFRGAELSSQRGSCTDPSPLRQVSAQIGDSACVHVSGLSQWSNSCPGAAWSYPVFADLVRDFGGARFQLKRVHASGL